MADIPVRANAVVVYALRKTAGGYETLLLKRNKGDHLDQYWFHIAGKVEDGEKGWQTALRELREETGLTPTAFYSANYCEQFYSVASDTVHILPLFVAFVASDSEVVLNKEHSAFRWVRTQQAMELLPFMNQKACLSHIIRYFVETPPPDYLKIDIADMASAAA